MPTKKGVVRRRLAAARALALARISDGAVTEAALAERTGYSAKTIAQYLKPGWRPSLRAAERFARLIEAALTNGGQDER